MSSGLKIRSAKNASSVCPETDFDQPSQHVDRNAVVELRPRLILQGDRAELSDKVLQAGVAIEDVLCRDTSRRRALCRSIRR